MSDDATWNEQNALRRAYIIEVREEQRRRVMGAIATASKTLRCYGIPSDGRISTRMPTELKVLVVDDDSAIREALSSVLDEEGYIPVTAVNGVDALRKLEAHRYDPFSLIVLDLMMPTMTGRQFREKQVQDPDFAKIPVLVFSAYLRNLDENSIPKGCHFLKKPLSLDSLLPVLAKLTGRDKASP